MNQMYPGESSQASKEGEAAHTLCKWAIDLVSRGLPAGNARAVTVDDVAVTDEMMDAVVMYAEDIGSVMRDTRVFGGFNLGVEETLRMPYVSEEAFGTCDCFLYAEADRHLYIWDFKYGHGFVEVFENWQMLMYLAGILHRYSINGSQDQELTVHFRLVQPRSYSSEGPIREWVFNASSARALINKLKTAADKALEADAECISGSWCKNCNARHACPAALKAGVMLYEAATTPMPVELSPEALGVQLSIMLRAQDQINNLVTGYETQAEAILRRGDSVPGFTLKETQGRETWDKPVEDVIALGDAEGCNLRIDDVVTPNQARKLGIDSEILKAYASRPARGLKLEPDSNLLARKVFQK